MRRGRRDVVVLVGEDPVHELGPAAARSPPWSHRAQHPGQLGHRCDVVGDVLEHLGGDDPVEGPVGERQVESVALDCPHPARWASSSPASAHGPKVSRTPATSSSPASRATTLAPRRAASKAWRPSRTRGRAIVAGPQAQPVVVDGQHQSALRERWRSARRAADASEHGLVALGGPLRRHLPGEAVQHALASAAPSRARSSGSSSSRPMASARAPGSSGATRRPVSPSCRPPRECPAGGRHQGHAARLASTAGRESPHRATAPPPPRTRRRGGQLVVTDPAHAATTRRGPAVRSPWSTRPPGRGRR